MRRVIWFVTILAASACGDDGATPVDASSTPDSPADSPQMQCENQGAIGQFNRRAGNPRVLPGTTFTDGMLDIHIADPDVRWDATASRWEVYWAAGHGSSYMAPDLVPVIRRATSVDRMTWTIDDAPVFTAHPDVAAWDHDIAETPTVIYNPNAPADRRYLLMYSGANGTFPGYTFHDYAIGAAFSADGRTFTRVPASESPHGKAGLVLEASQIHPAGSDGIVADPELVLVGDTYHLFFSSFTCHGANCSTVDTYGVSHATSVDGVTWTIEASPIRSLLRTSSLTSGGAQPSVVYSAAHCRWEMWLRSDADADVTNQPVAFNNMAGVYKAESMDGLSWNINYSFNRDFTWMQAEPGEGLGLLTGVDVAANGNGRLMLYVGFDDQNVPNGFVLPLRAGGAAPGVFTLNVATRDLP
ncbi:MAG: hypothetical protein ACKV2T_33060 [Kofleriaceae bacterium]